VYENGYCKHHGGKGQSLHERRLLVMSENVRKEAARLNKRLKKWLRGSPQLQEMWEQIHARKQATLEAAK